MHYNCVMENQIMCNKCNTNKPDVEFSYKNSAKGIRCSMCKLCHKEYAKTHYEKNKSEYDARARRNTPIYAARNKQLAAEYLQDKKCITCGESDLVVLDFDHRDETQKSHSVSKMICQGYAWNTILQEIAKCDVLCSNCHRRRTAAQFGTFRAMFGI